MIEWHTISPADAVNIDLRKRLDITAPLNEAGERCPWPWDPQQLEGAPLGRTIAATAARWSSLVCGTLTTRPLPQAYPTWPGHLRALDGYYLPEPIGNEES